MPHDPRWLGILAGCVLASVSPGSWADGVSTTPDPTDAKDDERLTSLLESIEPLKVGFNTDQQTPRVLAILSPTCPACRHGVEAIREALGAAASEENLRLLIVWAPMLEADDDAAARTASRLFDGLPTIQFYDPERRVGQAFRHDRFPSAADEMRRSLPPGHYLESSMAARSNDVPEWDMYLFFDAASRWTAAAPEPLHWVRQIARVGVGEGDLVSIMWKDSYASPPIEGSLADQLARLVE